MDDFEPKYLLSLSDEDLGIHLWAWWIGYQAEKKEIADPDRSFVDSLAIATLQVDTSTLSSIPLEKSLKCVAADDPEGAGKIFRQILLNGNIDRGQSPLIIKAAKHMLAQSKKAKLPRTKFLDNNETIDELIENVWSKHPDYRAKELWDIFIGEIKNVCGAREKSDGSVHYQNIEGKDRKITLGTFANKLTSIKNNSR